MHEDDTSAALARFRELDPGDNNFSISLFMLELIRDLKTTPHQLEHEIAEAGGPDRGLCSKAMQWLASERIVAITNGTIQLTSTGYRSLKVAARSDGQLSNYLTGTGPEPDSAEANLMMLKILNAHFRHRRGGRP